MYESAVLKQNFADIKYDLCSVIVAEFILYHPVQNSSESRQSSVLSYIGPE